MKAIRAHQFGPSHVLQLDEVPAPKPGTGEVLVQIKASGVNPADTYVRYATAYRSLFQRAEARPGEWVLVHGASGGVGIACVQLARSHGLRVIGTAGSERGRRLVVAEGAHHVLDHSKANYLDEIKAI